MRMRRHFLGWVGVTWVLATVCSCLFGAYLESDQPEAVRDDAPAVEPPRRVIPPKPLPPPDNAVASLIGRVRVERPHTYRHLTVFPLSLKRPSDLDEICTFAEAVRRDWIVIRESRDARVPVVMVRNDSMRHILLLGGELLVGGKQNRAVRNDVLLPPLSSFIEVPVYCVEKGRWQGTQDAFGKAPALVHPTLRLEAAAGAPQDSIWRDIQAKSSRLGVSPATGDYHHVRESGAVKAQMGDIARHFRRVPRSGRVGVVVTAGDRILGYHCNKALTVEFRDKIPALFDILFRRHPVPLFLFTNITLAGIGSTRYYM